MRIATWAQYQWIEFLDYNAYLWKWLCCPPDYIQPALGKRDVQYRLEKKEVDYSQCFRILLPMNNL